MAKPFDLIAVVIVATAAALTGARAEGRSLSCQSIDGQTICLSSSQGTGTSLSCQSIDGDTRCIGSGGLRCQTDAAGRLACTGGDSSTHVQIFRSHPPQRSGDSDEDEELLP